MRVPSRTSAFGLLAATAASGVGNGIVAVVVPWIVLTRTGSATAAGLVAAAALGPLVVSALLGGALVDRCGRRRLSVWADLLSAGAVAAIPLVDPGLGALALLVALGAAFDGPGMAAREALRPEVARRAGWSLTTMNSRGEAVDGAAALTGPALAGLGIAAVGPNATLWLTVALFTAAALLTRFTVPAPSPAPRPAGAGDPGRDDGDLTPAGARPGYLADVRAGLRLVLGDPTLRAAALLSTVLAAVLVPIEAVVLPAHLQASGNAAGLALLLSAFGGGSIAGALSTAALERRFGRRRTLLTAISLSAACVAGLALLPPLAWAAALAAVGGAALGPVGPLVAVVLQERTPEEARGRVLGTVTSLALAAAPAALLVAGPLTDAAGPDGALLALTGLCVLALLPAARVCRDGRDPAEAEHRPAVRGGVSRP